MNKASGDDGTAVKLSQILKGDCCESAALNMPANLKTQQWPQDWKGQISFQSQGKAMPKNAQTTASHLLLK